MPVEFRCASADARAQRESKGQARARCAASCERLPEEEHAAQRHPRAGDTQQCPSPPEAVDRADADPERVQAAGRHHEAHAVEQRALPRGQLGAVRVAVEDREDSDERAPPRRAADAARTSPPRRAGPRTPRSRTRSRAAARRAGRAFRRTPSRAGTRPAAPRSPARRAARPTARPRPSPARGRGPRSGARSRSRSRPPGRPARAPMRRRAERGRARASPAAAPRAGSSRTRRAIRPRSRAAPRPSAASAPRARGTSARAPRISATKPSCPSSTPTLKLTSASGRSLRGRPASVSAVAKPKPCRSPNANATTQGWRIVKLVSPRHTRTISGPRNRMMSAIAAFSGGSGTLRVPERRERERDAVRHRERGHRLHQHPAVGDDQEQPQHEQAGGRRRTGCAGSPARRTSPRPPTTTATPRSRPTAASRARSSSRSARRASERARARR